jgi:hypothetical protein
MAPWLFILGVKLTLLFRTHVSSAVDEIGHCEFVMRAKRRLVLNLKLKTWNPGDFGWKVENAMEKVTKQQFEQFGTGEMEREMRQEDVKGMVLFLYGSLS